MLYFNKNNNFSKTIIFFYIFQPIEVPIAPITNLDVSNDPNAPF
jgi:hypothetical protein